MKRLVFSISLLLLLSSSAQPWPVHGVYVQPSGDQLVTVANDPLTTGGGDPLVTQ